MLKHYYGIRDVKADQYIEMFPANNETEAVRAFQKIVNNPQSNMNIYAEDFQLYHMCVLEMDSGVVFQDEENYVEICPGYVGELHLPKFVVSAQNLLWKQEEKNV